MEGYTSASKNLGKRVLKIFFCEVREVGVGKDEVLGGIITSWH